MRGYPLLLLLALSSCAKTSSIPGPPDLLDPPAPDLSFRFKDDFAMFMPDLAEPPDIGPPLDGPKDAGPPDLGMVACGVKINEVQHATLASMTDEFIELYNSCTGMLDINNFFLVYRTPGAMNDTILVIIKNVFLQPKAYYLVGHSGFTGMAPAPNVRYTTALGAAGSIALKDTNGKVVDAVGWGGGVVDYFETNVAPSPAAGKSLERIPDGKDFDVNSTDFLVGVKGTPGKVNQ